MLHFVSKHSIIYACSKTMQILGKKIQFSWDRNLTVESSNYLAIMHSCSTRQIHYKSINNEQLMNMACFHFIELSNVTVGARRKAGTKEPKKQ